MEQNNGGNIMVKLLTILSLFICLTTQAATNYYVATPTNGGNDAASGDLTHPWATIAHAASLANPGDTVIVENGTYTVSAGGVFATLSRSGTSDSYITYKARNIGGAVLDGQNNYSLRGFTVSGNYINVEGFELKGVSESFFVVSGTHINIRDINAHDNAKYCTDTTDGLDFAYVSSTANTILFERCLIHDIGRLSPGEGGCTPTTTNYKAHDHGIYSDGSSNLTIQNCIFYNMHHGFALQVYSGGGATSTNVKFINNTCESGNPYHTAGHVILWGSLNGALIANNIFKDHYQYAIQIYPTGYAYTDVLITKNITDGGNGTTTTGTATEVTITGNYDSTDPLFTNQSTHDFTLQSSSPAINVGYATGVTTDFANNARVSPLDIGAYEYQSSLPPRTHKTITYNGKSITYNGKRLIDD
jgi:hypothetical protein